MHGDFQPQSHEARPGGGYERRDINAGWIFGLVGFLAVAGLLMHLVLAGVQERFAKKQVPTDRWAGLRGGLPNTNGFQPYPKLQVSPPADLNAFRKREELQLSSYGWINRTAGIVHIPIERAMELVVQRGLPQRSEGTNQIGPSAYELQRLKAQ